MDHRCKFSMLLEKYHAHLPHLCQPRSPNFLKLTSPNTPISSYLISSLSHASVSSRRLPQVPEAEKQRTLFRSRSSKNLTDWPGPPTPPYVPQHPLPAHISWLEAAAKHIKAQGLASKQSLVETWQLLQQRLQAGSADVERPIPGVNVPFGMLKVTLHGIDLATPALCFCVIKVGPHWGRTTTVTAATKATWNWEVSCFPVLPCPALPCPALPFSALSCPVLPCPRPCPGSVPGPCLQFS